MNGQARGVRPAFRREVVPSVVLLGVVPVIVYLASYIGRVDGDLIALPWREGSAWRGILEHQLAMLRFHFGLAGDHPYESAPWSWLALKRPVAYSFASSAGAYREMLAIGNPLTWWPGAIALFAAGLRWLRAVPRLGRPEVVLVAGLSTYLPWLVLSGSRSQVFIWYLLPTIPFLYGALGLWAALAWRSLAGRIAMGLAALRSPPRSPSSTRCSQRRPVPGRMAIPNLVHRLQPAGSPDADRAERRDRPRAAAKGVVLDLAVGPLAGEADPASRRGERADPDGRPADRRPGRGRQPLADGAGTGTTRAARLLRPATAGAPQADRLRPNRRVDLEAGHDLGRDGLTEQSLDLAQHRRLVDADQRDRVSLDARRARCGRCGAGSRRAPSAARS